MSSLAVTVALAVPAQLWGKVRFVPVLCKQAKAAVSHECSGHTVREAC